MYRAPKLVDTPVVVELPTNMYKAPLYNVVGNGDLGSTHHTRKGQQAQAESCPMAKNLEARQEAVLATLRTLKQKLDAFQSTRTTPGAVAASGSPAAVLSSPVKGTVHDLVVSANPSAPPLSLLVLRHLLAEVGCPVYCSSRLHSSVAKVEPKLHAAFTSAPQGDRTNHSLAFSLQWADVPTPSLMVNPLRQTRIEGEANIVRYISRLFPSSSPLNYEAVGTHVDITEADTLLDTLDEARRVAGGRGRGGGGGVVMKCLVERLSRQQYLLGNTCSVVDILAWSLLRQGQSGGGGSGGEVVKRWMEKVERLAGGGGDGGLDLSGLVTSSSSSVSSKQQEKSNKEKKNQQQQQQQPPPSRQDEASSSSSSSSLSSAAATGTGHKGRKELEAYLKELGIEYQVKEHKEVFTVDTLMNEMEGVKGMVMKNLFLRDKKKKLYLLSAGHDKEVDLKTIAKQCGTKDLRFSDEETLFSALGVKQGCVSALALINDASSHLVTFLLDRSATDPSVPLIHFHPMSNAASMGLSPKDFVDKFLAATGHTPVLVDL